MFKSNVLKINTIESKIFVFIRGMNQHYYSTQNSSFQTQFFLFAACADLRFCNFLLFCCFVNCQLYSFFPYLKDESNLSCKGGASINDVTQIGNFFILHFYVTGKWKEGGQNQSLREKEMHTNKIVANLGSK